MAAVDTRITNTPHTGFAGLSGVFLRTRAREIVECDGAFSSILTRLHLKRKALRFDKQPIIIRTDLAVVSKTVKGQFCDPF